VSSLSGRPLEAHEVNKRVPVAACIIVRDAERTLRRCLTPLRAHVDEINVLDTGSTDGTLPLLDCLAAERGSPIRVGETNWRGFADARNRCLAMVSSGIDWVIELDADEVVHGARHLRLLAARCERAARVGAVIVRNYNDGVKPGDPDYLDWTHRLIRRDAGVYIGVAYEHFYFAEAEESEDVLLAHPARVSIFHLRRRPDPWWHMPSLWRTTPARTPLRNWKLAEVLSWSGDVDRAVGLLYDEIRRTSADPVTGRGPVQRRRLATFGKLAWLLAGTRRYVEARKVYRDCGRYLRSWYSAADGGLAPSPDRALWIGAALDQDIELPNELTIDPMSFQPFEQAHRWAWQQYLDLGDAIEPPSTFGQLSRSLARLQA
jgi:glycosyltransferase involved in cell wall biosynthesis